MSKRLGLLIVMMLFVSLMTGCFGSDDSSTPTPAATSSVVITGTIPALSAPAGAPNYMVNYGTNYEMGVFNAATMTEITGSAVVINGTTYTATVPASAANVTALVVIRHKTTGKVVYSAIAGKLPTTTQMSAASVTKVNVSGVNLDGESTALATIAKDKGVVAPSIPASTSVPTMSAAVKSEIETAVGAATVTAIKDAITAVQTVLNASTGVSEATKSSILSALDATLSNVLNAFVAAVKDASGVITSAGGATTVTVGGSTINSTTTPAQVTDAVNHVTVVTVTAVTNPSDIAVANGTALSAITFPTTVTVTLSNATTATRNVVWSTTSTPAYNANVEGAYTFTGTVDGTTLTATVKVNVGIILLKVATPTFTPATGTFTAAQSVTIATTTEGATIHYTMDGSEPTTASPTYTSAISVSATTTVKAMAVKTGMTSSDVATATYTISISLVPVISAERAVKQANGDVVVTWTTNIVTPTAAKVVISGSVPVPTDPSVTETVSTTTSHTVTVPAATFPASFEKLTISYYIASVDDGTKKDILKSAIIEEANLVADPVITPAAGTYTSAQSVTITCATEGASIYYTIDGSTPNSLSTLYSGAITVSSSLTVKAIAIKASMTDSAVVSAVYAITPATKVLTGITLAASTGTVEANVAYTMPVVTAAYDDSTTGTVTATWVEVLDGGTAAVTLPVTKTVAGTYNFTASYTENGVTKTANFSLVVTEAVPVKTLESITVTATPAAPTCYVGQTTNVALAVVANYLTGTVESTEAVTLFTTSTNWANGVFTPATTVAGTENITVTFEGKTADVPVTVSVAPTGIGSVEVTALSVVEYGTTSPVVVVKDTTGATMAAADYTLGYAVNNTVVSVDATTGVITGGAYNSAAKTSILTVTATPTVAGGTAVSGTAEVTVTQDAVAPTIVSVTAKSSTIIDVLFSKALKTTTGATTVANYNILKISNTSLSHTIGGAALSADGKTVTLTLTGANVLVSSPNGYVLQMPNGAASKVESLAGVQVVANSEMIFTGVGTSDTTAPTLISTAFDGANKTVTFKFDKLISVSPATNVTLTSISFVAAATTATVTLTSSETLATTVNATDVVVNLSTATNASILALGEGIKVNVAAGAFKDTASTPNSILAVTGAAVSATPALSSVTYNQQAKTLTYVFNKTIKIASVTDITKFGYKVNGTAKSLVTAGTSTEKDTLATTTDSATIVFNIGTTNQAYIEVAGATYYSSVAANAVLDSNNVANGTISDATFTFTADTSAPTITKVEYNDFQHKLYLTFSKNMPTATNAANTNIKLQWTKDSGEEQANVSATYTTVGKLMTVTMGNNIAGLNAGADSATNRNLEAKETNRASIKLVLLTNHGLKDTANIAVADIAATDNKMVTYVDQTLPKLSYAADGATTTLSSLTTVATSKNASRTQLKLVFSEKVAAGTLLPANVSVVLNSNPTIISFAVSSITLLSDGYTALCTTADQSIYNGQVLKVTVSGVTDAAGNAINSNVPATVGGETRDGATAGTGYENQTTPLNVGYILGSNTSSSSATPKIKGDTFVVFTDENANNKLDAGDKITLTFDMPIAKKDGLTAFTLANVFELSGSPAKEFGTNATMTVISPDKVEIVLGTNTDTAKNIVLGTTTINVKTAQTELVSADQTAAAPSSSAHPVPYPVGSASGPILASTDAIYYEDTNASGKKDAGDKITFTFDQNLYATSGATVDEVVKSLTLFAGIDTTGYAYSISNKILTVTLGTTVPSFVTANSASASTYNVAAGSVKVENSWGKVATNGGTAQKVKSLDVTAPKLTAAAWYDENGNNLKDAGDYMLYTFSEPVVPATLLVTGGVFQSGVNNSANDLFYYSSGAGVTGVTGVWTSSTTLKGTISAGTFTADVTKVNANAGYTGLGGGATVPVADASDNVLAQGTDITITKVTGTATGTQTLPLNPANINANAAKNTINVVATLTDSGGSANPAAVGGTVKVYINGVYRQSIVHSNGVADAAAVTGTALVAGDSITYTFTESGKPESTFTAATTIPAAPTAADLLKLFLAVDAGTGSNYEMPSAANGQADVTGLSLASVTLGVKMEGTTQDYIDNVGAVGAGNALTPVDAAILAAQVEAGDTPKYYYTNAAGNVSPLSAADGVIIAAPNATDLTKLAIRIDEAADTNYELADATGLSYTTAASNLGVVMLGGTNHVIQSVGAVAITTGNMTAVDASILAARYETNDTPKYFFADAAGNHGVLSAADGQVRALASAVLNTASGTKLAADEADVPLTLGFGANITSSALSTAELGALFAFTPTGGTMVFDAAAAAVAVADGNLVIDKVDQNNSTDVTAYTVTLNVVGAGTSAAMNKIVEKVGGNVVKPATTGAGTFE